MVNEERLLIAEAELAAWIRQRNIAIAPASPLAGLNEVEPASSISTVISDRMAEAVIRVARSALEYGVRLSNPTGVVTFWVYRAGADEEDLAGHFQDADGNHLFAWTDEEKLRDQFYEKLLLDENVAQPVLRATLSTDGFIVLLAAIDLWRQRSLGSMLARDARGPVRFEQTELVDCLDRTLIAGDTRWLCAMAEPVCPVVMELSTTAGLRGLLELEQAGLVRAVDDLWEATSMMDDLAAAMSVPVAIGTLFMRSYTEPRERRQLTAFRGMGRLGVATFSDLDVVRPKVLFEDASWPDLDLKLADLLGSMGRAKSRAAEDPAVVVDPAPSPAPAAVDSSPMGYCTNCGREMHAGQSACTSCGRPAEAAAPAGETAPPRKKRHGKLGWLIALGVIILLPFESGAKAGLLLLVCILWGLTALIRRLFRKKKTGPGGDSGGAPAQHGKGR